MKPKILTAVLLAAVWLPVAALAQPRPLKVLVLYDMEGVTGATNYKHVRFEYKAEYEEGRKSLTADVNAAVAGLKAAGVQDIVIVDGHGSGNTGGPDVFEDQLLPPAKMISRDRRFDIYMDSYDHSFDAIVALAMHAGAGNSAGYSSHTYTYEDIQYKVNGVPFNESMILAMGAARYKIPLIMVSGDDQFEREVRRGLPWVKCAVVKRALGRASAESVPREEASRRIEAAAREAVAALASAQLPAYPGPYRFALTFQDEAQARNAALLPGAETLADPTTVQIRAGDFEEGYRLSLRLLSLAEDVAYLEVLQAVFDEQPNSGALELRLRDWVQERWLNLPHASAPAASSGPPGATQPKPRIWGAR
jgi:D-amino peptidase